MGFFFFPLKGKSTCFRVFPKETKNPRIITKDPKSISMRPVCCHQPPQQTDSSSRLPSGFKVVLNRTKSNEQITDFVICCTCLKSTALRAIQGSSRYYFNRINHNGNLHMKLNPNVYCPWLTFI